MRQKYLLWLIIVLGTLLPIVIYKMITEAGQVPYSFIWSIFVLPSIFLMVLYPNWKVVIGSAIFYTALKFITVMSLDPDVIWSEKIALSIGSLVNWSIHLTIGYFRIKYDRLLEKVKQMTLIDSLTGLYNRRYFELYLEKSLPLIKRNNRPFLLVLLDIDHFKKVNDAYGHLCGDEALKHIADTIKKKVRETDVFVRLGGEEFALLMPETNLEEGEIVAERIRESILKTEFMYKNTCVPLSISLGLSIYKGEKVDEFLEKTDQALYQAKNKGRNQLVVCR
ncbi:GGDEF domain-containing protein [Ammoniphilus sp. 3BR4]|uniref:GGDEF domain-containing protein n=1 Tax=Ammoniphilus sp. 3BR4 TaxID=3158265 RepID=UPI003465F565